MEKQKKKLASDITDPPPFKPGNEMDADELVHQNQHEEPGGSAFDEDEAVHKVTNRKTDTDQGKIADIDDLIHENEEEDDELVY